MLRVHLDKWYAGGHREERRIVWQWAIKLVGHVTFFSYEERCVTNPTMVEKDAISTGITEDKKAVQLREDTVQRDDFS